MEVYRAVVGPGRGAATALVADLELESWVGYRPVPGTLNVTFDDPPGLTQPPLVVEGHGLWPCTVNGVDGHLIRWAWTRNTRLHEVIAPARLRDVLKLADGDPVVIGIIRTARGAAVADPIWIATRSFATYVDDKKVIIRANVTRVREGHVLIKENPSRFRPIDVHYEVETARQTPGGNRSAAKGSAKAKPKGTTKAKPDTPNDGAEGTSADV